MRRGVSRFRSLAAESAPRRSCRNFVSQTISPYDSEQSPGGSASDKLDPGESTDRTAA
ncbi:MAG TPA: hypothetical protein VHD36_02050 [Pirellulales bacterium]|nr:hypothetical protein [Pirellulales bacterium]